MYCPLPQLPLRCSVWWWLRFLRLSSSSSLRWLLPLLLLLLRFLQFLLLFFLQQHQHHHHRCSIWTLASLSSVAVVAVRLQCTGSLFLIMEVGRVQSTVCVCTFLLLALFCVCVFKKKKCCKVWRREARVLSWVWWGKEKKRESSDDEFVASAEKICWCCCCCCFGC